jgi:peptidoglycan/LPS O-acetylase OafA/YrhL
MSANADMAGGRARLLFIDYLRAAAILYIVGFWHLWEYAPDAPAYQNGFTHAVIFMVLGLFVFLSGVLLGRNEVRPDARSVLCFYRRRLLRIWPLYILALLTFVAFGITNWATAAKSAIGLVMFFGPSPATLWFVAMLVWFYLLAPFLIISAKRVPLFAGFCAALYVGMAVVAMILPQADKRLFIYFPAFAAGIAAGVGLWAPQRWCLAAGLAAAAFIALLCSGVHLRLLTVPLEGAVAVVGPVFVYAWCWPKAAALKPVPIVMAVSYASFAMYLFHRPILGACQRVFMPDGFFFQWVYLTLVCLPLVGLVSWIAQRAYDQMTTNLRNS